jgi:Putative metallopeptidase domain
MQIDKQLFRAILYQLIDENPFACRAVLSICDVEFTENVETLAVTLSKPVVLKVNLRFVQEHCHTEDQVKAVLVHEVLHILLRHTSEFKVMTPVLNVALDAVINAIVHRKLGPSYSSMMAEYYRDSPGFLRILRPITEPDQEAWLSLNEASIDLTAEQQEEKTFFQTWQAVYDGKVVAEDVYDLCRQFRSHQIEELLRKGWKLIGGHNGDAISIDDLEPDLARRIQGALESLDGAGISRDPEQWRTIRRRKGRATRPNYYRWLKEVRQLLRRLVVPDPRSRTVREEPTTFVLPALTAADRRGYLRSLWNPILPDSNWLGAVRKPAGLVQIYLDVSGSMDAELQALMELLAELISHIKIPFWAFSTEVEPATIRQGQLQTRSTGGTLLSCVIKHIAATRPRRALIITDGFVEQVEPELLGWIADQQIEALIPASGTSSILEKSGILVTQLPARHA